MEHLQTPAMEDMEVRQLTVPPHSVEAEQSVLGGLLIDGEAWEKIEDILAENDFYRHEHRLIFGQRLPSRGYFNGAGCFAEQQHAGRSGRL